jgi:hypothetical protein
MTEEQIDELKVRLNEGHRIFWLLDEAQEVISVTARGDEGDVGNLKGGGGLYIALYNVDPTDLYVCKPLFQPKIASRHHE